MPEKKPLAQHHEMRVLEYDLSFHFYAEAPTSATISIESQNEIRYTLWAVVSFSPHMRELETAKKMALQAGKLLRSYFAAGVNAENKGHKDTITVADREAQAEIIQSIKSEFPEDRFFAEESDTHHFSSGRMWVIDPLDGTVNFSRGIPLFGTSIAFVVEGEPQCGVIYLPMFDELFFAEKGKGAFCNDEPIRVSKTVDRHRAIVSVNDFNIGPAKLMKPLNKAQTELLLRISPKCMRIKNLGSASVELSFVASGRLDAYFMLWTNFWDVAAGSLIIAEAGGKATDYRGEAIKHDSRCLLFANEALYPDYLQILNDGGNLPHALDEVKTK